MSILKNARHEKFAQLVASGMTLTESYEKAGYAPNRQSAYKLHTKADIAQRVAELKEASAERAEIDRAYILKKLHAIVLDAHDAGQFTAAINGLVKIGEESCDMFIAKTKSEHTFRGDPSDLTKEQLAAIAAKANGDASRTN